MNAKSPSGGLVWVVFFQLLGSFWSTGLAVEAVNTNVSLLLIQPETNRLRLNEVLSVKVCVTNMSGAGQPVRVPVESSVLAFALTDGEGRQVRIEIPITNSLEQSNWNYVKVLRPGEMTCDRISLKLCADDLKPGEYSLTVARRLSRPDWQELKSKNVPLANRFYYLKSQGVKLLLLPENNQPHGK